MKKYTMSTRTGHHVQFCVGDIGFFTIMDNKNVKSFESLAKPLGISVMDVSRFMGDAPSSGKTDDETMKILMKLMCMCGYSNTLAVGDTEKGAA